MKEKNLRKQIERELKDLNEANEAVYKDSCSSCYERDSSSDESGDDKWHAREQGEGQGALLQKVQRAKRSHLRKSNPRLQP